MDQMYEEVESLTSEGLEMFGFVLDYMKRDELLARMLAWKENEHLSLEAPDWWKPPPKKKEKKKEKKEPKKKEKEKPKKTKEDMQRRRIKLRKRIEEKVGYFIEAAREAGIEIITDYRRDLREEYRERYGDDSI